MWQPLNNTLKRVMPLCIFMKHDSLKVVNEKNMDYPNDRNIHRPPHVYLDNTCYFIVSRTLKGIKYFNNGVKKDLLQQTLMDVAKKYNVNLYSWVLLDNHYQLVAKIINSIELSEFIGELNGKSSYLLNKLENKQGRKIWYQYREKIIDNEKSFWTHVNYNHHNPVKHGYVKKMKEYKWSSLLAYLDEYGMEYVADCFANYPVIDFNPFSW
jgi:putative transposase